jgi:hypothetical protein
MPDLLFKFPASWPTALTAVVCMVVLAALDFLGTIAATQWVERRSPAMMALGVAAFVALFWFYASALHYAGLAVVTFGWIVFLQVAVVLLDRYHYGLQLPLGKWMAIVVILAAQGYLIAGPSGRAGAAEGAPPSTAGAAPARTAQVP